MSKEKLKHRFINHLRNALSYIVPKKKGLLVFVPIHSPQRLSGNLKAFLRYLIDNQPEASYRLITMHPIFEKQAKQNNIKHTVQGVFSALWSELRAEIIILDASAPKYRGNYAIVQLWHGVGFKNVGLLNETTSPAEIKELKKHYRSYKLVASTCPMDVEKQNKSFGITSTQITGYPRNDKLVRWEDFKENTQKEFEFSEYKRIISYVPTFRDQPTQQPFSQQFWAALNEFLIKTNSLFLVKKHPWDEYIEIPNNYSHIKDVTHSIFPQELFMITDLLISDYSSVFTDFVLTGKPILAYTYDLDAYISTCRSIYYKLEEILPKPFIADEWELLERIKNDSWMKDAIYIESYHTFRNNFNTYQDAKSSERIWEMIKQFSES